MGKGKIFRTFSKRCFSSFALESRLMHQNSEKHLVQCKYEQKHTSDDAKVQCFLDMEKRCLRAGLTLLN